MIQASMIRVQLFFSSAVNKNKSLGMHGKASKCSYLPHSPLFPFFTIFLSSFLYFLISWGCLVVEGRYFCCKILPSLSLSPSFSLLWNESLLLNLKCGVEYFQWVLYIKLVYNLYFRSIYSSFKLFDSDDIPYKENTFPMKIILEW